MFDRGRGGDGDCVKSSGGEGQVVRWGVCW